MKQKQGKNKKKTWKQIQHGDVDKFLDEIREDERLGGIRSKRNEELFAIDDLDFTAVEKFSDKIQPETIVAPTKPKRRGGSGPLFAVEDLKCFQLLTPHTAVRDPIIKRYLIFQIWFLIKYHHDHHYIISISILRNRINKRGERKTAAMAQKDAERQSRKKPDVVEPIEECKDPWARKEPKS